MPGHLWIPALDKQNQNPSTLSWPVLTGLLRKELGFNGLILSDAMNMGGITRYSKPGEAEVRALKAGMDVLEYVSDPALAIKEIRKAVSAGELSQASIDEKCRKVLAAKYWAGLNRKRNYPTQNLTADLSAPRTVALVRELYSNALTVLRNKDNLIPLKQIGKLKIAVVTLNGEEKNTFSERITSYSKADLYRIDNYKPEAVASILSKLNTYDIVIAAVMGTDQKPGSGFGIPEGMNGFLERLAGMNSRVIISYFGNPHALALLGASGKAAGLVLGYQENEFTEDLAAQLIFGGIGAKGKLPVTINDEWISGFGLETGGGIRISYGLPENAGISSVLLTSAIDSIAGAGLAAGAYPGCEVIVARKGKVVFHKTYGYHTYDNRTRVEAGDLYDFASVTKISSTLAGLMLLDGEGKFSPEATLGSYLPYFRRSNKENMLMKDMLAHQAGLTAWIPFWRSTVKENGEFKRRTFDSEESAKYPLKVAQGLYMHKNYRDKIFKQMKESPVGENKYLYSDLTFIISTGIIDRQTGMQWTDFVTERIYREIGAGTLVFNPYLRYPLSRIVPTEYDSLFRKQLLHGTVHDEGAAMLGGISGHAGLFGTANDLMKLMELYRRMGEYGGEQIISREVLERYTKVQFPENNNRRGLGYDNPSLNMESLSPKQAYPTTGASPESFGHSGYTGTFVWVDPKYEISYVFLSNRVYPTRNNNLLSDMNIRTNILQAIYDSIKE
ncbi:MAG: serine hydrolase [Bacteroidales bacterium]|nr:serine hydrolase [Bacteroidales bacterium]